MTHCYEKSNVDNLIDIKEENKKYFEKLLSALDKTTCSFNSMRILTIELDKELGCLREQIQNEGNTTLDISWGFPLPGSETVIVPHCSSIAKYNMLIQQYINNLDTILKQKVPSCNGLAVKLIKKWEIDNWVYTNKLIFKKPHYNWIRCAPTCVVDNMVIDIPSVYSSVFKNVIAPIATPYVITKDVFDYVTDEYILLRTATFTFNIDLPASPQQGTRIVIKDVDSNAVVNNVTVTAGAGDTVDGAATDIIAVNGQSTEYVYAGTDWVKILLAGGFVVLSETDNIISLDTATIGYTLYLPASPTPLTKLVFRDQGNSGINNVVLNGNGTTINGLVTESINSDNEQFVIEYNAGVWKSAAVIFHELPYVDNDIDVLIHIGSCEYTLPFVAGLSFIPLNAQLSQDAHTRLANFNALLCYAVPLILRKLNASYNKNIKNIDSCIKKIKKMIIECELI